jgi:hypothetical protein
MRPREAGGFDPFLWFMDRNYPGFLKTLEPPKRPEEEELWSRTVDLMACHLHKTEGIDWGKLRNVPWDEVPERSKCSLKAVIAETRAAGSWAQVGASTRRKAARIEVVCDKLMRKPWPPGTFIEVKA